MTLRLFAFVGSALVLSSMRHRPLTGVAAWRRLGHGHASGRWLLGDNRFAESRRLTPTASAAASMRRWCILRKSRCGGALARNPKSCSAASDWRTTHGILKRIAIWAVIGTGTLVAFIWWNGHVEVKKEQESAARAQARKERAAHLLNSTKAETRVFDMQQGQLLVIDMPLLRRGRRLPDGGDKALHGLARSGNPHISDQLRG